MRFRQMPTGSGKLGDSKRSDLFDEGERMKTWKRITAIFGMALGAGVVWLAVTVQRVFSSSSFFNWGSRGDYAFVATLAALGIALIIVAYLFGFRWNAK